MEQNNAQKLNSIKSFLSEETFKDLVDFLQNGESPFYLMQNGSSIKQIVTRFQTTTNLKTFGAPKKASDWQLSNYSKPVLSDIPFYTNDGKVTPFAFAMNSNQIGKIKYPLISMLLSQTTGEQSQFNCTNYESIRNAISSAFSIKIVEKEKKNANYKKGKDSIAFLDNKNFKGFLKYHATKALKLCKTIFTFGIKKFNNTKLDRVKIGKIYLKQYDRISNTQISQVDKLTSIINKISKRTSILAIKQLKLKNSISEYDKTLFLTQLLTDLYVARANSYGSAQLDKKVSDALSLQISNLIASMGSIEDVKKACKASATATEYILEKMGKTPQDIIDGSLRIGKPLLVENQTPTFYDVMFAKHNPTKIQEKLATIVEAQQVEKADDKQSEQIEPVVAQQPTNENVDEKFTNKKSLRTLTRKSANKAFTTALEKALKTLNTTNIANLSKENITKTKLASEEKYNKFIENFLSIYNISKLNDFDAIKFEKQFNISKQHFSNPLTAEDYAKILASYIINKKEDYLNKYFDEDVLKPCYNFKNNTELFENFDLKNSGKTLQSKLKLYISSMMKLISNKLIKEEKTKARELAKQEREAKKAQKKSDSPTL